MPRMKLLLLFATLFTNLTVFATSQEIGLIMIQRGGSVVIRGNQTLPTKVGLTILEKDQIQTDTDSYLKIVMKDRNVLVITGGSQITLENYSIKKNVSIQLDKGSLRHIVQKNYDGQKRKYEVKTAAAVMGVRGTDFISEFDTNKNETVLCTLEGKASFRKLDSDKEFFAEKDQFIRFKSTDATPEVKAVKTEWLKKALERHPLEQL